MKQELFQVKEPKSYDYILLATIALMGLTSVIAIYSAFELIALESPIMILFKQVMWYGIGTTILLFIMYIGNETIYSFVKISYWIILGMLIYLFLDYMIVTKVLGPTTHLPFVHVANGATSWFKLPFGLGTFQPSEFMKIILILMTADIIHHHNNEKLSNSYQSDIQLFLKVLKYALPPMLLIYLQPDTGVCIIIFVSLAVMILCSGINRLWFFVGFSLILLFLVIFFYLYFFNTELLKSLIGSESLYKLDRITGWLNPEADIQNTGNQLYSALMAMGSAGISGHGMQQYLVNIPEAQTDFIFAVIGQSFGLIGTLFVVGLCLLLDLRLLTIAMHSKNMKEKYYISGIIGMLLFQQIENMGMIVGLLPITGITLPFISAGGSSLLSYFIAIGIVVNASKQAKKLSDYVYE